MLSALYLVIIGACLVYVYAPNYLVISVAIAGILVPTILSWPSLSELPWRTAIESFGRTKIVMVPTAYDFGDDKVLVTIMNAGDATLIGELMIVIGFAKATGRWKEQLGFDILGFSSLQWGYTYLENGDVLRLTEKEIRGTIKRLIQSMNDKSLHAARTLDADILLLALDVEGIEMRTGKFPVQNLLSACKLGISFSVVEPSVMADQQLWVQEVRMNVKAPSGEIAEGKTYPVTIQGRAPPFQSTTRELLSEIVEDLSKLAGKNTQP
jgi:hypothetical protein